MLTVLMSDGMTAPAELDVPNEDPIIPVDGSLPGTAQTVHKAKDININTATKGKRGQKKGQQILYLVLDSMGEAHIDP